MEVARRKSEEAAKGGVYPLLYGWCLMAGAPAKALLLTRLCMQAGKQRMMMMTANEAVLQVEEVRRGLDCVEEVRRGA